MIIHNGKRYKLYMNGKEYILPNNFGRFNTYIGGVGQVLRTKQQLLDRLNLSINNNLSLSDITNFQLQGDDIMYFITEDYDITEPFRNFTAGGIPSIGDIITYFIDLDNHVIDSAGETFNGFMLQTNMTFAKVEGLILIANNTFRETDLRECYLPNATSIIGDVFRAMDFLEDVYIPNATLGNATNLFSAIPDGVNIYCKPGQETGTAITAAINNENAIAIPVLDQTPPSAITDLTVTDLGSNTYQFNFTTPASTNTIQNYRVFAFNGTILSRFKYYDTITASGDSLTLPSNTTKVWLQVADEYLNLSNNSNERSI